MPLSPELQQLYNAALAHQAQHGCSAHPYQEPEELITRLLRYQPQRILELGSGIGFSACLMAITLPHAHIDTVEGDPDHTRMAQSHINNLQLSERITLHTGSFKNVLPDSIRPAIQADNLQNTAYDMVFFDGHTPPLTVVRGLHDFIRPDGILICANMNLTCTGKSPRLIREFSQPERWEIVEDLENGGTFVVRRV